MSQTLYPKLLRMLHVEPAQHPRSQPHVSSASGLVLLHSQGRNHCYAVADDEHHLGHFVLDDGEAVELLRIFPGDLPDDAKQRKKAKPDLECLCALPAMPGYPQGALLTLGSGSKNQRHTGLLMPLNAQGLLSENMASTAKRFDLTALYQPLHGEFDDLNIEGCFVHGEHLHLLQRGNKGDSGSACICFDAAQFQAWLLGERTTAPAPEQIFKLDLGDVNGIPLTPTDGIALPNGHWLVSATAENTHDSFTDGPCAGSALVVLNSSGHVLDLRLLQAAPKVEGMALLAQSGEVLMLTDADDPALASQLLSVPAFWL
ncbi:hypothetical protein [Variovorax sp. PCZ-1]|uniref:DUF6910 family protein n=1 Tax=Variovorax sp. PCZ-1 TaxID=2835533 RepID=UPI001BD18519|nr:hypothetical protein [Variovorax sp. PCZ-1]MBS7808323.1 hypothetical protein [Variovorax sp. PCZ-1]